MMLDEKQNDDFKSILGLIPTNSVGAEIGTWRGNAANFFARINLEKLYLVDPYSVEVVPEHNLKNFVNRYSDQIGSEDLTDFQSFYDTVYMDVVHQFKQFKHVEIYRQTSEQFFNELTEQLDWVYVDGDHSYEGCLNDLRWSYKAVKSGGIILGDDYNQCVKAIKDFCKESGLIAKRHGIRQYSIQV